jgi:uncharacterized protein (DUF1800 family)
MDDSSDAGRRTFLRRGALLALGATAFATSGCRELQVRARELTAPTPADWTPPPVAGAARALHILNRAAFGPRPGDVARVARMGASAYLEEQLADRMDEDPAVGWRVGALDILQTEQDAPDALTSMPDSQLLTETAQAALLRAVYSRHQLREVMADFWTNHFNIYALKNNGRELIPVDAERVLRPHLLGRFHDLLTASAHSPAMLAYLDNNQNRRGAADNVNENYARELLELHTLGVKSGYTQRDIHEVARCFTGWTVAEGFKKGQYAYDPTRHDEGEKFIPFLNLRIRPKGGQRDADTVLEALCAHPATARFVARKLCQRFLGQAPESTVEAAATAYLRNGSDIRSTLRPILLDALCAPDGSAPLIKRPLDLMVSALRALAADTDGGADLQRRLSDMGQPLYEWPMPDGFPEKTAAWSGALLPRWNFALDLASNAISGTSLDLEAPLRAAKAHTDDRIVSALAETVYGLPHDDPALQGVCARVQDHVERARRDNVPQPTLLAETTALLLAAPPFQWK